MQKRNGKWVSHNKVLVGSGDNKKPHARNPNFDSEETKLLIQLWGDPQIQKTLVTIHKKHPVIAKIAEKMRSHGYNRTTEEINTRIKNLKCLYNRIKKDLDSGLLNEPSWKHYNAMHEILSRPVFGNSIQMSPSKKIVISPPNSSDHLLDYSESVKIEKEDDNDSMDFDEQQLRPEDLLTVEEEEINHDDIEIKSEPEDEDVIIETKIDEFKSLADSSTDVPITMTNPNVGIFSTETNIDKNSNNLPSTKVLTTNNSQNSTLTTSNGGNKISIVPTKLLLKPPANSISSQSGALPMKLLFVNTNSNAHSHATFKATNSTNLGKECLQKDHKINFIRTNLCSSSEETNNNNANNEDKSDIKSKKHEGKLPSIKNLLSNIHKELKFKNKIELERNEVEQQRFLLEKQKFEYEKSLGNEILSLFHNAITNFESNCYSTTATSASNK